jgi:hypothetical protein
MFGSLVVLNEGTHVEVFEAWQIGFAESCVLVSEYSHKKIVG